VSIAPARPSRARATLVLALVFAAGFASVPWRPASGWVVGVAACAAVLVLASWGGAHVTTILRRRFALFSRKRLVQKGAAAEAAEDPQRTAARAAALIRVPAPAGAGTANWLPLSLIAGYLDRYGVRCSAVRVAFRRVDADQEAWITLVVDAVENLVALRARSPHIQLHELAEATCRRLAAQLREEGFSPESGRDPQAEHADAAQHPGAAAPSPIDGLRADDGAEDWNGVVIGEERVSAYSVLARGDLGALLAEIAAYPARETWTVLEFTGQPADPDLTVACALRTKGIVELLPAGLRPRRGDHLPALAALAPTATTPLSR
jgi:type VII secretion protein EccE